MANINLYILRDFLNGIPVSDCDLPPYLKQEVADGISGTDRENLRDFLNGKSISESAIPNIIGYIALPHPYKVKDRMAYMG